MKTQSLNTRHYIPGILLTVILFAGCKKDNQPAGGGNTTITNTPNLITLSYQPGVPIDLNTYHIYDLNHDDNKDKKYSGLNL